MSQARDLDGNQSSSLAFVLKEDFTYIYASHIVPTSLFHQYKIQQPGDSKWPFGPLVAGNLIFQKGTLNYPQKRSQRIDRKTAFCPCWSHVCVSFRQVFQADFKQFFLPLQWALVRELSAFGVIFGGWNFRPTKVARGSTPKIIGKSWQWPQKSMAWHHGETMGCNHWVTLRVQFRRWVGWFWSSRPCAASLSINNEGGATTQFAAKATEPWARRLVFLVPCNSHELYQL